MSIPGMSAIMSHSEAEHTMAVEQYLLGELLADRRDAFEEHMFGCLECARDVRLCDLFVRGAKEHLTSLPFTSNRLEKIAIERPRAKSSIFSSWFPALAVPLLASLFALVLYQNVAVIPRLKSETAEFRTAPWTSMHVGARSSSTTSIEADRAEGAVLIVQFSQPQVYPNYHFELYNSESQKVWDHLAHSTHGEQAAGLSLVIPPSSLGSGFYTLVISGISEQSAAVELERRSLTFTFNK